MLRAVSDRRSGYMAKSLQALFDKAVALKERGKLNDAIAIYRSAVKRYPESGVAEHNLAGALGDAGRASEAQTHILRAFRKGLDAPQSWLVYARALLALGQPDKAQAAYEKVIDRNPLIIDAQLELAQLIWMMTGDSRLALARLDATIAAHPDVAVLHHTRATVLRFTEGQGATLDFVRAALQRWPEDVTLLVRAVEAGIQCGETDAALAHSERIAELEPGTRMAQETRARALLANGRAVEALEIAEQLTAAFPDDQFALALLATSCRLVGDERYEQLHDYDNLVRAYELATPKGWSNLAEYLADLRAGLAERHQYKMHPFNNSLAGGSMIMDFLSIDNRAIRSLAHALRPPIDAHVKHLGKGEDVVRARNSGRWDIGGIWSVRLRPDGFHHNHVHPKGWLSSACYIDLPDAVHSDNKEGWIKFGEPGMVTSPELSWEHAVEPRVGTIVLFPSYMWHGTIPFSGEQERMTCALDIVPA
jgi:tetratricopeptide (TPR) repeat protein